MIQKVVSTTLVTFTVDQGSVCPISRHWVPPYTTSLSSYRREEPWELRSSFRIPSNPTWGSEGEFGVSRR